MILCFPCKKQSQTLTLYQTTKAFADNKINVTQMFSFVFHWVENEVGKGENAGN